MNILGLFHCDNIVYNWLGLFLMMSRCGRLQFSYMRECCFQGTCYKNFTTLDNRIVNARFTIMFDYLHKASDGELIKGCPNFVVAGSSCSTTGIGLLGRIENNFTTLLEVNCNGNDKIFMNLCVSDKYKGHYAGIGLTRNMVDIPVITYIVRNTFVSGISTDFWDL